MRDIDYGSAFFARGAEHGVIERTAPSDQGGSAVDGDRRVVYDARARSDGEGSR